MSHNGVRIGSKETTGWKAAISVAMSHYNEAGSIIAIASSPSRWQEYLGIDNYLTGLLAALGANAFGAAVGAAIGGPLRDRFGRKFICTYDLMLYLAGVLLAAFAGNVWMLLATVGFVPLGLTMIALLQVAAVGVMFAPDTRGQTLQEIEAERYGAVVGASGDPVPAGR